MGTNEFDSLYKRCKDYEALVRYWIHNRILVKYRTLIDTDQLANDVLFDLIRLLSKRPADLDLDSDECIRIARTLTSRHVINSYRHYSRQKRYVDCTRIKDSSNTVDKPEYEPSSTNEFLELKRQIKDCLQPNMRRIVRWKLDGWTNLEIALELRVSRRSIERMLKKIEPAICELVLGHGARRQEPRAKSQERLYSL